MQKSNIWVQSQQVNPYKRQDSINMMKSSSPVHMSSEKCWSWQKCTRVKLRGKGGGSTQVQWRWWAGSWLSPFRTSSITILWYCEIKISVARVSITDLWPCLQLYHWGSWPIIFSFKLQDVSMMTNLWFVAMILFQLLWIFNLLSLAQPQVNTDW